MITINKKRLYQAMCALNDECFVSCVDGQLLFFNDRLSISILPAKMDAADRQILTDCVMEFKFVRRWLKDCKGNITIHNVADATKEVTMSCAFATADEKPYIAWHPLRAGWTDFHQSSGHACNVSVDINIPSDDIRSMWRAQPNAIEWRSVRKMVNKTIKADIFVPDFQIKDIDCSIMSRMDDRVLALHFMNDGKILVEGKFFQMLCDNGRIG